MNAEWSQSALNVEFIIGEASLLRFTLTTLTVGGAATAQRTLDFCIPTATRRQKLLAILASNGSVPERTKGPGCKLGGIAFVGSNPTTSTKIIKPKGS